MYGQVLGLDIGSWSLKGVVARGGLGRFEILRYTGEVLREEGASEIGDPAAALSHALSLFRDIHRLAGMDPICTLPGPMTSTRRLSLPFSDPKKIRQTVPFEVESQVPFGIDEIVLDYQVLETASEGADVLVGLARRELIARHLRLLEDAGLDPRILELDAPSLANLAPFIENADGFAFLADVGHAKTALCALSGRKLHSARTLPLGGLALTLALADDLRVERGEAERRKHEAGLDLLHPSHPAFARALDRFVREIDRTFTAPENARIGRPDRIVLFGGSARMRGLSELLQERLGIPVEAPVFRADERFAWRPNAEEALVGAAALALALRGVLRPPLSRLNLRQEEFAYRRDFTVLRRRFLPTVSIAGALLLLVLVNIGVIMVQDRRQIAKLDAQMAEIFRQTQPGVTRIVDPLSQMRSGVSEMQRRAQALGIYGANVTALGVLREISSRVPTGVDVTITDLSIDEARIRVHGSTPSYELVDRLKSDLQQVSFFREVNVADVKTDRDGGKSFNLTITMGTPGAPVAPAGTAPRRRGA